MTSMWTSLKLYLTNQSSAVQPLALIHYDDIYTTSYSYCPSQVSSPCRTNELEEFQCFQINNHICMMA